MTELDRFLEIIATYQRHNWEPRRVLMSASARVELNQRDSILPGSVTIEDGTIDAIWFSRPSSKGREAWELRLVGEPPYALFEAFEADETEERRREVRREMEARMSKYAKKEPGND